MRPPALDTRARILAAMRELEAAGELPTVRRIAELAGLASSAPTWHHLQALVDEGLVQRYGCHYRLPRTDERLVELARAIVAAWDQCRALPPGYAGWPLYDAVMALREHLG